MRWKVLLRNLFWLILAVFVLGRSAILPGNQVERVRAFTRMIEFDFVEWTLNAAGFKSAQFSLSLPRYLPEEEQIRLVRDHLDLIYRIRDLERQIEIIYTDPTVQDPAAQAEFLAEELSTLKSERDDQTAFFESVIQSQVEATLADLGLGMGGQPFPPLLFHTTELPHALIVSPREVILQVANISISPDMTQEEITALESEVEESLDVSALVENIGGIGLYPTMVIESSYLPWLIEVVSHEWAHNYLTLRPLGVNYSANNELRTMNETTASIVGNEVSVAVLEKYYPDLLPPPPETEPAQEEPGQAEEPAPPVFDFRQEMYQTRVWVDRLLAEGKIEQAEHYMELRRQYLWEHGYQIRRLNQAYFAFHGAYADAPMGAAGMDPVGPAVRALRDQSDTLSDFLFRISWMTTFEQLQEAVAP